ncbi:type II secretion system F family protein [Paenibacillus allorhizosphaerae]|uniref:Type II secretion system protein F n=1 Tax=Paenibacillus allorhizosphaerae TaxID=2849866 RepID=A0ABN7TN64_9BACL|nr:type II secretion system F family protein [Paenibacillus allorhizosphaerae]CAG7648278.1 Type II secretion system protein F [Paenibacillus allorhizosphaerae]
MPKFIYKAVDDYGNFSKGTLEAQTFVHAMEELKGRGLWVQKLVNQSASILHKEITIGGPRVKTAHFTVFCRQLSTMYKAGVNMVESFNILSRQTESKPFKKVLQQVAEEMQGGTQLSVAIGHHPTVFNPVFTSMVSAGEASGNLDEMLERLAVFYEKEHYTREKVKSAMIYPIMMGIMTIMVVTLMMTFVVPRYITNFQAMGIQLPLPTRIVVHISDFIRAFWYLIPLFLVGPVIAISTLKKTPGGLYIWDYVRLKMPVFGKLAHKQSIARFSRTFSSLYAAAIPMLHAMTIVSTVVGNEAIGSLIRESREGLRSGSSVAEPFQNSWLFPPMVVQMMAIGEKTGTLDAMLDKVADFYEAEVDATADRLKALLEPLMIILLSGIVGGIVLAIMLPTFTLMDGLNK